MRKLWAVENKLVPPTISFFGIFCGNEGRALALDDDHLGLLVETHLVSVPGCRRKSRCCFVSLRSGRERVTYKGPNGEHTDLWLRVGSLVMVAGLAMPVPELAMDATNDGLLIAFKEGYIATIDQPSRTVPPPVSRLVFATSATSAAPAVVSMDQLKRKRVSRAAEKEEPEADKDLNGSSTPKRSRRE